MGKDDTAMLGGSGYDRIDDDFYETEAWVTEVILKHIKFRGPIWEPAAGKGAIAIVLQDAGNIVFCSDLVDRGCEGFIIKDFFDFYSPLGNARNIVTNTPYGDDAEEFVNQALSLLPYGGKLVMICRHEWICAKKRRYLFDKESAFCKLIILNKRPRWIKGSTGSPRHNYGIYVFDRSWRGKDAEITLQ